MKATLSSLPAVHLPTPTPALPTELRDPLLLHPPTPALQEMGKNKTKVKIRPQQLGLLSLLPTSQ